MPANPQNPFPTDLSKIFEQLQTSLSSNGWWNQVDRGLLEWPGHEMAAANTGLFFIAAQTGKTIYTFSITDLAFKISRECTNPPEEAKRQAIEFSKQMDAVEELKCIKRHKFFTDKDPSRLHRFYANESSACSFSISSAPEDSRRASLDIRSFDEALVNKVRTIANEFVTTHTADPQLYAVSEDDEGHMMLVSIGKPGIKLERINYSDDVLEGFDYVVNQLNSKKPFGRLVILYGPPGTGKTHLLRGMFESLNLEKSKFIFLQPEFLFKHSVSALTRLLLDASEDGDALILLIEDADDCLVPRQTDNMVAVSTLLNLADGFIGNMLDIRVIATTNASKLGIDGALRRPGRLCRIMEVGLLAAGKANEIVKKLTGKDGTFKTSVTLAEVYAAAAEAQGQVVNVGKIPTASSTGVGFAR